MSSKWDMPKQPASSSPGISRRQFLYYSALAASATAMTGCASFQPRRISANERLNIGAVGTGGKGSSDINCCASENIVALCDVDRSHAARVFKKYPKARQFTDYRRMLDEMKEIDILVKKIIG